MINIRGLQLVLVVVMADARQKQKVKGLVSYAPVRVTNNKL